MAFVSSPPHAHAHTHTHTHTHTHAIYRAPLHAQQCRFPTCVTGSERSVSKEYVRFCKERLLNTISAMTWAGAAIRNQEMFLCPFPVKRNTVLNCWKWLCVRSIQPVRRRKKKSRCASFKNQHCPWAHNVQSHKKNFAWPPCFYLVFHKNVTLKNLHILLLNDVSGGTTVAVVSEARPSAILLSVSVVN